MDIVLFGLAGMVGRHLAEQALADGHRVRALVSDRSAITQTHGRLRVVEGDVADGVGLDLVMRGAQAVLSVLGPTSNSRDEVHYFVDAASHIIGGMKERGIDRYIGLTSGAVNIEGERRPLRDRLGAGAVRFFARHAILAKEMEFDLIADSGLEWVLVRPSRIVEGPLTRSYREGEFAVGRRATISAADVAHFMLAQLTSDRYLRSAPLVSY